MGELDEEDRYLIIALEEAKYQLIAMRDTLTDLGEALRIDELNASLERIAKEVNR